MKILVALLLCCRVAAAYGTDGVGFASGACRRLYAAAVFDGAVDYERVAKDPDRAGCAALLAAARPDAHGAAALAFWIDAYNLLTIMAIAAEPTRWSAQQDGKMLFRDRLFDVAGQALTLDQIERDKIGALTRDPRVEFLLSCGSRSCALPPADVMARIAGTPEVTASAQPGSDPMTAAMAEGMKRWFSRPDNLRVDRSRGVVEIGQLLQLDWHGGDFERAGILLVKLVGDALAERDPGAAADLRAGKLRIAIRPYDWRVNRVRRTFFLP